MRYTSRTSVLGLPLVDVVLTDPQANRRPVARGWIAVGPIAIGVIAVGGAASGGIAIGGLSIGVISLGGVTVGALALGGLAVGYWSLGGAAIAVNAALGGLAVAHDFALGGAAFAHHANDAAAREFFASGVVFPALRNAARYSRWLFLLLLFPALLPFVTGRRSNA